MTDEELDAMITDALERSKDAPDPVTAVAASFDTENRLLIVLLSTGQRLAIPQEDLQYLADVSPAEAADLTIEMLGRGLHWEKLDLDFSVEGLLEGRRGNTAWMAKLHERWHGKISPILQVA